MELPVNSDLLDLLSQDSRFIVFESDAEASLTVERFRGEEVINDDFCFELDCLSPSAFLDPQGLIGQRASVGIATDTGSRRYWHGIVVQASSLGGDGGLARYQLTLRSSLAFLATRRNSLIFQDKSATDILAQVLADYPQLAWRNDSTLVLPVHAIYTQYRETDLDFVKRLLAEAGLSFRFEHNQQAKSQDQTGADFGHTLVVFDADASLSLPAGEPADIRFHRLDATEKRDAITHFVSRHQLSIDQVTVAQWVPDQLQAIAGHVEAKPLEDAPELPVRDFFEAQGMPGFNNAAEAERIAANRLDAQRMLAIQFEGQGAVRTLETGKCYTLTNNESFADQAFVPLRIQHEATNNLSAGTPPPAEKGSATAMGKGSYRQQFLAVPAGTPLVPDWIDKPVAPGCSSALVVGVAGETLTSNRDHQVRIQFFWQRGSTPLAGGQTDSGSRSAPEGHAPGNEQSGTWVRVAEAAAGAHQGHSFVPRLGDEVLVEFTDGDIDRPVVVGQLYNGQARSPFVAGEASGINHPGTLSGIQTQHLDHSPAATWQLDDAAGQASHSLRHEIAQSQLNLGYLIDYQGAQRGDYLGEGALLGTQGWAVVRAGEGLLLSTSARPMGQSTQMDAVEAAAQLKTAAQTSSQLGQSATQAGATGFAGKSAPNDLHALVSSEQQGKYSAPVNGQATSKPNGDARDGGDAVERFAEPALLMDSAARLAFTSGKSLSSFAGEHQHLTCDGDVQLSSGASLSVAAGDSASLYAAEGGIKVVANHGPVSVQAHGDALQLLADKDASVTSSGDSIQVLSKGKIQLTAGQSCITLDGANLTVSCPGSFSVKSSAHSFGAGKGQAASPSALPTGLAKAVALVVPSAAMAKPLVTGASNLSRPAGGVVAIKNAAPSLSDEPSPPKPLRMIDFSL